jgi:hypothetical protein
VPPRLDCFQELSNEIAFANKKTFLFDLPILGFAQALSDVQYNLTAPSWDVTSTT